MRDVADRLCEVRGVRAVVLGGSRAVGVHDDTSDVDLGLYYGDETALDLDALRSLGRALDDSSDPIVTEPWAWGRWVNGGAWLTIGGRRVDWIYRRISHVEDVLDALRRGEVEVDWMQHPPFGAASTAYGGETDACVVLRDDAGHVARLKDRITVYPDALRTSIAQNWTWAADFALRKGRSHAARGDVFNTGACLARATWFLAQVVHALDRRWSFPESRVLDHAARLPSAPTRFDRRAGNVLASPGRVATDLGRSIDAMGSLLEEVARNAGDLYRAPTFPD